MIVTVTPNPSIDRTVTLATPLTRGSVHRVSSVTTEPGGKGVNVARALVPGGRRRRRAAARLWHRSAGDRPAEQRRPVPLRPDHLTGANQHRHHRDGRHHNENQRARRTARRRRHRRVDPVGRRLRRACVVGGDVGIAAAGHARSLVRRRRRRACPLRLQGRDRHLRRTAGRPGRRIRSRGTRSDQAQRRGARGRHRILPAGVGSRSHPGRSRAGGVSGTRAGRTAASALCSPRWAPQAQSSSITPAAGWPHRRRSSRAAPSEPETPPWPVTCAPTSAAPSRRNGCGWPSRMAAPLPLCRAPPCPVPPRST